jgi:SET family sugar efflux transporter-like MFS transporter
MAPLLLFCLAGTLVMLSDQAKSQFLPLRLTQQVHLAPSTVGLLFGAQAVIELATMPLAGWLADAAGLAPVLLLTFAMPVPYLLGVSVATGTGTLLALQAVQATAVAGFASLGYVQAQRLAPGREGLATSLYGSAYSASQLAAGLIVGGMAQQAGIAGALRLSTIPVVLGCLLLVSVLRWGGRPVPAAAPEPAM